MKDYQSLAHTRWDCKYHIVFIPKWRKQKLFGALRRQPVLAAQLAEAHPVLRLSGGNPQGDLHH